MRSCDTVSAGAFFPQAHFQVPQKEMRQHTRQHMVIPAGVFAPFIMGHAQFRFRFLEALFNRPPHTTQPHEQAQGRARGRVAGAGRRSLPGRAARLRRRPAPRKPVGEQTEVYGPNDTDLITAGNLRVAVKPLKLVAGGERRQDSCCFCHSAASPRASSTTRRSASR